MLIDVSYGTMGRVMRYETRHRYRGYYWRWTTVEARCLSFSNEQAGLVLGTLHAPGPLYATWKKTAFVQAVRQQAIAHAQTEAHHTDLAPDGYPWIIHAIPDWNAYRAALIAYRKEL